MTSTAVFYLALILSSTANSQTCLSEPPELQWSKVTSETHPFLNGIYTGNITLDAHEVTIETNNLIWNTRLFNGMLPGPTIRLKRGFEYRLTFINNLGPESSQNPTISNVPKDPNTTNLHTHGLHISGRRPSDSNYISIGPGESYVYTWILPCDHSGGVHVYHPHHHGSTQAQAGGGAIGAILVEDDTDQEGLPSWYSNMTQFVLVIQKINLNRMSNIYNTSVDYVFSYEKILSGKSAIYSLDNTFLLLNGEYLPTICLNSSEWTKLRIAHVDPLNPGYFIFDEACDIQLLTRDGVIIHGANDTSVPRQVSNVVWLSHLGRADIAIHCSGDPSGTITYNISRNGTYDQILDITEELIGYIKVSGTDTLPTYPLTVLTPFTPIRPWYLRNLVDIRRRKLYERVISPSYSTDFFNIKITDDSINYYTFRGEYNYTYTIPINSVVEFKIEAFALAHPLHIHVNHMQVIYANVTVPYGFQEYGDFLDTFYRDGIVRWQADTWGGTITLHCHILQHEDQGAMGTILIQGGCDYDYKTSLNPLIGECSPNYTLCTTDTSLPTVHPTSYSPTAVTSAPSTKPTSDPITSAPTVDPITSAPTVYSIVDPSVGPTVEPSVEPTVRRPRKTKYDDLELDGIRLKVMGNGILIVFYGVIYLLL